MLSGTGSPAHRPFSESDWDAACHALFAEGRDPLPCPECGRTGFFGPRIEEPDQHYRQCRFCGFTQYVGQEPQRYRPTVHDCPSWPRCAKAPYVWWVAPGVVRYRCPFCGGQVVISRALVAPPVENPQHPWWKVPQHRSRFYYVTFWERWGLPRGRVNV
jgi:hypothetical protein